MKTRIVFGLLALLGVAGCETYGPPPDLATAKPGIWVSPQGCQSWYFELGHKGFMSPRLTPEGKPVCDTPPLPEPAPPAPPPRKVHHYAPATPPIEGGS